MGLPGAIPQNPTCGVCGEEARADGSYLACEYCGLMFDPESLAAEFLDPNTSPCGTPCDNTWHGDHKIRPGQGFQCGTCQLPSGHTSDHWPGCVPVAIAAAR